MPVYHSGDSGHAEQSGNQDAEKHLSPAVALVAINFAAHEFGRGRRRGYRRRSRRPASSSRAVADSASADGSGTGALEACRQMSSKKP